MKAYWDSSALIAAAREDAHRNRLASERGYTRRHALAEMFSALTGKAHLKIEAGKAVLVVKDLVADLDFVELSTEEILQATRDAESLGVRGGGIHDLLHARAALKSGAKTFLTLDRNDFEKLVPGLSIEQI
jgi:predicted nucleic acid-binding protein